MKGPHYTSTDLLRLRQSPLVCKPRDLPPPEEWIGSPPDKSQKPTITRAKTDGIPYHDRTNIRPSLLLETRHATRGSSTLPEDIVLGPPKTAFASATSIRNLAKNTDSSETQVSTSNDDNTNKNEKTNYRDRPLKDKDRGGRERWRTDETDDKTTKEDSEGWISVRQRKSSIQADGEEGREQRWGGGRHQRFQQTNPDSAQEKNRDRDKNGFQQRGGMARGRNEYNRAKGNGDQEKEDKEVIPGRERRDRGQSNEWDWGRGGRIEREPEWMDSKGRDEKSLSHTAEDFQRWKERMKAASATEETPKVEDDNVADHDKKIPEMAKEEQKTNLPIIMETGVDQFFGLWEDSLLNQEKKFDPSMGGPPAEPGKFVVKAPVKGSRFKSFFAPQEAATPQVEVPVAETSTNNQGQDTTSEDKKGFQRILQMLGGASLSAGNMMDSSSESSEQERQRAHDHRTRAVKITQPSALIREVTEDGTMDRDQALKSTQENFLGQQMPQMDSARPQTRGPQKNNNEFLLSLMHQSRTSHHEPDHPIRELHRPINSISDLPANISGEALFHYTQGVHPGFKSQPRDNLGMIMKGNDAPPPGLSNDPSIMTAGQPRRQTNEGLPPSSLAVTSTRNMVQKPPGLEHIPTTGWPNNTQQQQQAGAPPPPPPPQGRQIAPPPGLPSDPTNNSRPSTFGGQPFITPPPGMPYPPNLLHRGSGMGQVMNPNMPPPGFFNINMPPTGAPGAPPPHPPPGYPPLPFVHHPHQQQDGMMTGGGVGMPPPPPPPPPPPGSMPPPPPPPNVRPGPGGMVVPGLPPPLPPASATGSRFPFGAAGVVGIGPGDLSSSSNNHNHNHNHNGNNGGGGGGVVAGNAHVQTRRV